MFKKLIPLFMVLLVSACAYAPSSDTGMNMPCCKQCECCKHCDCSQCCKGGKCECCKGGMPMCKDKIPDAFIGKSEKHCSICPAHESKPAS